jgi:hypothetical protein
MQKFGQDYRDEIGLGQSPVNHMSTTICQACVTACDTHDSFCQAIFYVYDADFVCDYLRSLVRAGFLLTRSTGRNSLPKRIWNEDPSCSISGRLCFRSAKFCWLANMATSRKGRTIVSCKGRLHYLPDNFTPVRTNNLAQRYSNASKVIQNDR